MFLKDRAVSLKNRLIASFSLVIITGFLLFVFTGTRMIGDTIVRQAQDKVILDLNSAREVYLNEIANIHRSVRLTAARYFLKNDIRKENREKLVVELKKIRAQEDLDILDLTDHEGIVLARARNPAVYGDVLDRDIVRKVLATRNPADSTEIFSHQELSVEGSDLAEQAVIPLRSAAPGPAGLPAAPGGVSTSGMVISAAAPVYDYDGTLLGILYGGKLINRHYGIVDRVKEIVYKNKKFKDRDIGTVTIFQDGLRISTNVKNSDGSRAIGTHVSSEVYEQVVRRGVPWTHRAFVVNAWYITAYEPIKNASGQIIGMLYVGILEAPYIELRNQVIYNFLLIASIGVVLLTVVAYLTASRTTRPLKKLIFATQEVARGNLAHRVHIRARDETGQLADSFNRMMSDLEQVTRNYCELNRTLEDKVKEKSRELENAQAQLIQTEKLSSLGKMAAGIAHEINNPLTAILINAHLMAEELKKDDTVKENIELIISETTRCSTIVKDLLHFSRQTLPVMEPYDVSKVIDQALALLKNQFLIQKVTVVKRPVPPLPDIIIDKNKIEQVLTNVLLNSLDAMPDGGECTIDSRISADKLYIEIEIRDTGCGIPAQVIGKIFDPFFTTKGTRGTGLGLSVSYGIIEQHGGKIEINSEVGKGTTTVIYLPLKGG